MLRRPGFTVLALVAGGPRGNYQAARAGQRAVAAEKISCTTARECELRMPRGSRMVLEVAVEVPSSAE